MAFTRKNPIKHVPYKTRRPENYKKFKHSVRRVCRSIIRFPGARDVIMLPINEILTNYVLISKQFYALTSEPSNTPFFEIKVRRDPS